MVALLGHETIHARNFITDDARKSSANWHETRRVFLCVFATAQTAFEMSSISAKIKRMTIFPNVNGEFADRHQFHKVNAEMSKMSSCTKQSGTEIISGNLWK